MQKYMVTVSFELTRRCNMNCEFCAKGEAQNKDITPAVINKALDELSNFEIYCIRVTGGEPMLNKTGFIYLIDELIRRDFKVCDFLVFTNGTVQDQDIKTALMRIGKHCQRWCNTKWGKDMQQWIDINYTHLYDTKDAYVSVICSTNFHNNKDILDSTIDFYNDGVDPALMIAVDQTKSILYDNPIAIILEGNAEKNLKSLSEKGYEGFKLYDNKYSLIFNENDKFLTIQKTLNICVNGKVTAGCTQSYERADREYICSIFDCNGNLYRYIDEYSWKYPLSKEQVQYLIGLKTPVYLHKHNIKTFVSADDIPLFEKFIAATEVYADLIKEVHERYSTLTHREAQEFASLLLAYEHREEKEMQEFILDKYYGDDTLTDEDIETGLQILAMEHTNRVLASSNNALLKVLGNFFTKKLY